MEGSSAEYGSPKGGDWTARLRAEEPAAGISKRGVRDVRGDDSSCPRRCGAKALYRRAGARGCCPGTGSAATQATKNGFEPWRGECRGAPYRSDETGGR